MAVIDTRYFPSGIASKTNLPDLSATLNLITEESFAFNNVIVADSMVLAFPSITIPFTLPSFSCEKLTSDKIDKAIVSRIVNFLIFNLFLLISTCF